MRDFTVKRTRGGLKVCTSPDVAADLAAVLDALVDLSHSIKIDSLRLEREKRAVTDRSCAKTRREFDRTAPQGVPML